MPKRQEWKERRHWLFGESSQGQASPAKSLLDNLRWSGRWRIYPSEPRLIYTYGSSFLGPDKRGTLFSGTRRMLQNQPAPYTDSRRRGRPLCLPSGTGDHRGSPLQIFAKLNHYPPIIFIGMRRRIYSIEGRTSNALRSVEQSFRKEIAAATN